MALTLPDHVNVGDSGHVADTNLIIAALADLDGRSGGGSTILSGTATPTAAVGAVGDYYLDTDDRVLYGPKGVPGWGSSAGVYGSRTPGGYQTPGPVQFWGNDIKFLVAGRVTGLRHYRHASTPGTDTGRTLRAWDTGGTQITAVTTTGETGSGWKVATLGTPITVAANEVWRVSEDIAATNSSAYTGGAPTGYTEGDLQMMTYFSGATYPTTPASSAPHVDVVFEKSTVSEWPVALKSIPPGGTTGQVLKKTSGADYAVAWVT